MPISSILIDKGETIMILLLEQAINVLEKEICEYFNEDSSGHDFFHLKRVLNLALQIQAVEKGDVMVIGIASFVHDIHRIMQGKREEYVEPRESLPIVKNLITPLGLLERQIEQIMTAVEFHEEYSFCEGGLTNRNVETMIVQDADNLDAIGAIGIARVFAYGGSVGNKIYDPAITIGSNYEGDAEAAYSGKSSIHHFREKLLKLKDNMNTKTGKLLAEERHAFMELYLNQFYKEWGDIK